jgi:hypothetical protein
MNTTAPDTNWLNSNVVVQMATGEVGHYRPIRISDMGRNVELSNDGINWNIRKVDRIRNGVNGHPDLFFTRKPNTDEADREVTSKNYKQWKYARVFVTILQAAEAAQRTALKDAMQREADPLEQFMAAADRLFVNKPFMKFIERDRSGKPLGMRLITHPLFVKNFPDFSDECAQEYVRLFEEVYPGRNPFHAPKVKPWESGFGCLLVYNCSFVVLDKNGDRLLDCTDVPVVAFGLEQAQQAVQKNFLEHQGHGITDPVFDFLEIKCLGRVGCLSDQAMDCIKITDWRVTGTE